MKIIQPPHKKTARKVESISQIKEFIEPLRALTNSDSFPGRWPRCLALSHAQVSDDPYSFFIVHREQKKWWDDEDVIINARILEKRDIIDFDEACMSFPFRNTKKTERYSMVKAEYYVPRKMLGGMRKVVKDFMGPAALVFQHEIQHAQGSNIYHK